MTSSLLPPGSSVLERRLAQACSGISDLNVPLRDLWNPWKCPATFLPYLAWAVSVDGWDEDWSEQEKRRVIGESFWLHQRKGTVAALRRVVENMGYSLSIEEWWQVAEQAGTFRITIDVNDIGITEALLTELERLINITKPVSRHLSGITMLTRTAGDIYYGMAVSEGDVISVWPAGYEPDMSIFYNGRQYFDGECVFTGNASDEN